MNPWLILLIASSLVNGLRLVEIKMDKLAYLGSQTVLSCHYEMNGDTLYSIKWYKDDLEFFRFVPMDDPPVQTFPVHHFTIDLARSNQSQVSITPLNISASGVYQCEVSAEAPSFETVRGEERLTVIVLPRSDPVIEGGHPVYREGDHVKLLCKSGPSHPPARLVWYINGLKVNSSLLRGPSIFAVSNGLQVTSLGMEFKVQKINFINGLMKLTCLASIDSVYLKSNEETVESTEDSIPTNNPNREMKDKFVFPGNGDVSGTFSQVIFCPNEFITDGVVNVLGSSAQRHQATYCFIIFSSVIVFF